MEIIVHLVLAEICQYMALVIKKHLHRDLENEALPKRSAA